LINGLASFSDPKLQRRAFELLLDGTLRAQDYWAVTGPSFRDRKPYSVFWKWFTEHYDKLVELRGPKSAGGMPWSATGFCSDEGKARAEAFFGKVDSRPDGMEHNLAQALE